MMDRRRFFSTAASPLFAAIAGACGPALKALAAAEAPIDLGPTLEQIRERFGLPAVGAIAVSTDRVIARGVAGFRRMGEPSRVSPETHWQLGSVTKTFTGTLTGLLIDRGKLSFDTTLGEIYPELVPTMAPNVANITIRQLILHRSGMVHDDAYGWGGGPEINGPGMTLSQRRQRSVPAALKQPLEFAPGVRFNYSNRGYNTLGAALEKITGRSYEDLIADELARPLDLGTIKFGEPALDDPSREPWPHVPNGPGWKPIAPVPRNQYGYWVYNPAGGLSLTLDGFGRWMQAHLRGEQKGGLLSPGMFKTLHMPPEQGGVSPFGITANDRALGRALWFAGSNMRNSAEHMILLEQGVGFLSVINAAPPPESQQSFFIMNTLHASAQPGRWPAPSLAPPSPNAAGEIEGEALEIAQVGGGQVRFQSFPQLSRQWQLLWTGAKDGKRLVLRFAIPAKGRYAIEGSFARNRDYGDATFALGSLRTRLSFNVDKLVWETMPLGEVSLDAGVHELAVTAHRNAGEDGIACHLGLDVLRLRQQA
jgi:CubicO group peptidase (beta-lactamase class C family)